MVRSGAIGRLSGGIAADGSQQFLQGPAVFSGQPLGFQFLPVSSLAVGQFFQAVDGYGEGEEGIGSFSAV